MLSDLDVIGQLGAQLQSERQTSEPSPWAGSPFEWLRNEAPSRKGAIGKELVKRWARSAGFSVTAAPARSQCDCIVAGLKIAIKFGLRWANGILVFEQIRPEGYDAAALLGLEPQRVHLWIIPRDALWRGSDQQHGAETRWLRFRPAQPPPGLAPFGGSLEAARASLLEQTGGYLGT